MPSSIHVIANQNARRLARQPALGRRIAELARGRAHLWMTTNLAALGAAAQEIAAANPSLVVLCGGDGTFMASLTALERAYAGRPLPAFALAPAGTVATVARNWGGRASLLSVLEAALAGSVGSVVRYPTLRVREHDGETRIGFTIGTGLVARFFERYYAEGAAGYRTALGIVLRTFVGSLREDTYSRSVLDPLPCSLTVDGNELLPRAYSLVVCSVLRDLGLHMHVTYRAGEEPMRPHLVASSLSTRRLGPQAPRVLLGKGLRGAGGFDGLVDRFSVRFPDATPGPYVLDGDMFHASELSVSAGEMIRVLDFS